MVSVLKLAFLCCLALTPVAHGLTDSPTIRCSAKSLGPFLDFEFRFVAGHWFTMPVRQFWEQSVQVRVTLDLEPIDGTPGEPKRVVQHLGSERVVPKGIKGDFNFPGAVTVGLGKYRSSWTIQDINGRKCSGSHTFTAKLPNRARGVDVSLGPGEIVDTNMYIYRSEKSVPRPHLSQVRKLKVFLSLDVLGRRGRVVRPRTFHLMPQVAALRQLSRSPSFNEFSLVAFSFEDQRVLARQEYGPTFDFRPLSKITQQLRPEQVDFRDLMKGSEMKFFERLVEQEIEGPDPPHGVVFLGQDMHFGKRLPRSVLDRLRHIGATVAFFDASRYAWAGLMGSLVRALGGREYRMKAPSDLARAISSFESQARASIPQ